jgi:hypothetical protein
VALNNAPQARTRPTKKPSRFNYHFAPHTANFIRKLVFHPCSIPFQVYVETFIPCFIDMLLFESIPELDDIFRAKAELMVAEGRAGSSKRRRHLSSVHLEEAIRPEEKPTQQALKGLLRITQPLEKIGYLFLLYAGTERFFHNWAMLLNNFEHCAKPDSEGPLQMHSLTHDETSPAAPQPLFMFILDQDRAHWGPSTQQVALPFGNYSVTVEATFKSKASNDYNIRVGFFAPFSFGTPTFWSEIITIGPGETGSCLIQADVFFPAITGGSVQWIYEGDAVPVGVTVVSSSISIYSFQPGR